MNRERRKVAQARRALGNKTLCPSETTPLYERKKAMRAFCGRLFGRGKGAMRPLGCYNQSGPRLTSSGTTWAESGPRKRWPWSCSDTFEMKSTLSGWNLFIGSLFMSFLAFRRNACLSGKVALASGSLALLSALASTCSSWWAEQMECHAAVVCVSIRLIEQVLRSLWWVVGDEKRVSISPTLWERFSLLFW